MIIFVNKQPFKAVLSMQCPKLRRVLDENCDQIILTDISCDNFEKQLKIFCTGMLEIFPEEVNILFEA